jgi:hypothetical protein
MTQQLIYVFGGGVAGGKTWLGCTMDLYHNVYTIPGHSTSYRSNSITDIKTYYTQNLIRGPINDGT